LIGIDFIVRKSKKKIFVFIKERRQDTRMN
jgi:hypothetical protein